MIGRPDGGSIQMQSGQKPPAIIIGLDCTTGLQSARILASHNIPVIAIARDRTHYCCATRVCKRIVVAETGSSELVDALARLGKELDQKAVLFPCTDASVLLISRHRRSLARWYHVLLPEPDVVETLTDKAAFYTYAQAQGLAVPRTVVLSARSDAEEATRELEFPCIVKPSLKSSQWDRQTKAKAFKVADAQELLAVYDRCSGWAQTMIAQEWVGGTDADLYTCNCYFDARSMPLVTFVSRKLRQWPPETGVGCFAEECRNETVLQETIRLFRGARYRGLGYLEMKRQERTGRYFITEANIGRPTGRSAMAEAGGVDLLYAAYCDALGWPPPANLRQKYDGVRWIYWRQDLQSAWCQWRRGGLTLSEWWRSLRGPKVDAVFCWTDPVPFLRDLLRAMTLVIAPKKQANVSGREKQQKLATADAVSGQRTGEEMS